MQAQTSQQGYIASAAIGEPVSMERLIWMQLTAIEKRRPSGRWAVFGPALSF
jgi:hypothetical protein